MASPSTPGWQESVDGDHPEGWNKVRKAIVKRRGAVKTLILLRAHTMHVLPLFDKEGPGESWTRQKDAIASA